MEQVLVEVAGSELGRQLLDSGTVVC